MVNERVALFVRLKRNCSASVYMQILLRKALKVAIDLEGRLTMCVCVWAAGQMTHIFGGLRGEEIAARFSGALLSPG